MQANATPRPLPKFYETQEPTFSTKRARRTVARRAVRPPAARTAPVVSRVFARRLSTHKPHLITFKSQSDSYLDTINSPHYDESRHESYFEQSFAVEAKVGEGSFGEVFRVRSKEDGRVYAVKRALERFRNGNDRSLKLSEVQKHETLPKHANLVNFVRAWEERGRLYIQTELCNTSLYDFALVNHDIPERVIWNYLVDLLLALKHLHDHNLVHMDVKPENVFISGDGICKLGDFGLVFDLNRGVRDQATEGDSKYLAPELLRGDLGKEADVFSLGISLLELSCDLDLPASGDGWHLLRQGSLPTEHMGALSPQLRSVIGGMMEPLAHRRPTADELLRSAAVRGRLRRRRLYHVWRGLVNYTMNCFLTLWLYASLLVAAAVSPVYRLARAAATTARSSSRPSTRSTLGQTPVHDERVVMPLRFDTSFSDDEDVDVSSIRSPSQSDQSKTSVRPLDLTHEDTSSSSEHDDALLDAQVLPQPCNSTPAHKPRIRQRRVKTDELCGATKRPRLRNPSFSPVVNGSAATRSPLAHLCSPATFRSRRFAAPLRDGPPLIRAPSKNLRLLFESHGSSSAEEY